LNILNANRSPIQENVKSSGIKNILPEIIENDKTEHEHSPHKDLELNLAGVA